MNAQQTSSTQTNVSRKARVRQDVDNKADLILKQFCETLEQYKAEHGQNSQKETPTAKDSSNETTDDIFRYFNTLATAIRNGVVSSPVVKLVEEDLSGFCRDEDSYTEADWKEARATLPHEDKLLGQLKRHFKTADDKENLIAFFDFLESVWRARIRQMAQEKALDVQPSFHGNPLDQPSQHRFGNKPLLHQKGLRRFVRLLMAALDKPTLGINTISYLDEATKFVRFKDCPRGFLEHHTRSNGRTTSETKPVAGIYLDKAFRLHEIRSDDSGKGMVVKANAQDSLHPEISATTYNYTGQHEAFSLKSKDGLKVPRRVLGESRFPIPKGLGRDKSFQPPKTPFAKANPVVDISFDQKHNKALRLFLTRTQGHARTGRPKLTLRDLQKLFTQRRY